MIVSVDTMVHHAATSAGVPVVVLWGRSKAEHFGYTEPNIVNIQGECPGGFPYVPVKLSNAEGPSKIDRPCINGNQWSMDMAVCPIEGHPCMESISVEQVINACESLIRGGFVDVQ
ncbi:MAG: hypothetical protein HY912_02945 [Desulfomonile tiedjei]|uniref:Uncharacterized protein n=1 Tax=Desulfomonile tiedjei TaxID=2358 RepID=A0A9D6Z254_9BACT|nr:hypothetical protein [Desulfomonile tiedjei]